MQSERDALLKLIQGMREEYEATMRVKEEQQAELRGVKVSSKFRLSLQVLQTTTTSYKGLHTSFQGSEGAFITQRAHTSDLAEAFDQCLQYWAQVSESTSKLVSFASPNAETG